MHELSSLELANIEEISERKLSNAGILLSLKARGRILNKITDEIGDFGHINKKFDSYSNMILGRLNCYLFNFRNQLDNKWNCLELHNLNRTTV